MKPEKQVSPVIRISRGEGDASARATHLEAATRKFLVTTNERKQMSTKTNFKRIVLVAVASLGLGLLSSVPSQATTTVPTITGIANGSGGVTTDVSTDSLTAATLTISAFMDTAGDSLTVEVTPGNTFAETTTVNAFMYLSETGFAGTVVDTTVVQNVGATSASKVLDNQRLVAAINAKTDTVGVSAGVPSGLYIISRDTQVAVSGNVKASFVLQLDSSPAASNVIPGTYTYTVNIRSYDAGAATSRSIQQTLSIVISRTAAAEALLSTVAAAGTSSLTLGNTVANMSGSGSTTTDSSISVVSTASTDDVAFVRVRLRNAQSGNAQESVTATITAGRIGDGTTMGRSITLPYTSTDVAAGYKDLTIEADGTAGTAVITISVPSFTFAVKTISFYASAPATLVASVPTPNLATGSNSDALRVIAKDAGGNLWSGTLYVYASTAADALIAGSNTTPVACYFDSGTDQRHECTVNGNSAGTAKLKVINASTVAAATVTSNEVSVVVNTNTAATVKISFDKATYTPNEKARIYVTPLDSAGKEIAAGTFTNLLASGGITSSGSLTVTGSTTSDSLTAVTIPTSANSSSTTGAKPGSRVYEVFMPAAGGVVTLTATGGSGLPVAGRVAVSATATVTDSGAQALAAVSALATTVASLKTLITTLTNLVLKIQKKVKA